MNQAKFLRVYEAQSVSLQPAVEGFLAVCRARGLGPNTIAYYSYRLGAFVKFLGEREATADIIREFVTHEREHASASLNFVMICSGVCGFVDIANPFLVSDT